MTPRLGSILRHAGKKEENTTMKKKAYLGIDIGSISTKGVIIDENNTFLAESYLWTEGNPIQATREVLHALEEQFDREHYRIAASGTTGSAANWWGSMIGAPRW